MMKTKKARIEKAREIIDRNEHGVPFSDEDLKLFSEITDCALRYVCRAIDPNYPTNDRHIVVMAYDWQEPRGWSWRKAIQIGQQDSERHSKSRLSQAMRAAVNDQIVAFAAGAEKACQLCATTETLTVDHVWPPFSQIANEFINDFGTPDVEEDNGSGFKISDNIDLSRWQDYHLAWARLGILCRSCNSKKGARPST